MKYTKKLEILFVLILLLVGLFFATYKLTESPPIWFDEGNYIQVAINFLASNKQVVQVAPGELVPATYLTAGYPLLYPLSLSFKYFGVGLLQARAVMVIFILALILVSYLLMRNLFGFKIAVLSSLLLVSFPPLYGHGKNVMGEIPGMFFLILFLFFVHKIEKTSYQKIIYYILAGLAAGLCLSTKPVFVILLPAILVAVLILRKKIYFYWQSIFAFLLSFLAPVAARLAFQYHEVRNFNESFFVYTNPHGIDSIYQSIINNFLRFFTEVTPAYFLILLLVWISSVLIRFKEKKDISATELISFCFSIILPLAYLFTSGFFRYFLPAHLVALLYFPFALFILLNFLNSRYIRWGAEKIKLIFFLSLVVLVSANFYHLEFKSWVAEHYQSKKSSILSNYFQNYTLDKSLFLYNAPEVIIFLPTQNYYQYVEFTPLVFIGQEQLAKIEQGIPDEIIIPKAISKEKASDLTLYQIKDKIGGYVIWEKKK